MTVIKEINIDKMVATNTIFYDKLRQVKSNYHHIIFYQPLEEVEKEQKKNTFYNSDKSEHLASIKHPFRCYECSQPFLSFRVGWSIRREGDLIRREHLLLLMKMAENNDVVKYSRAVCCKCAEDKCDCRAWFSELERELEEKVDKALRAIRTMKRCKGILEEELKACKYEDEKEIIKRTIDWNIGDSYIKEKEEELKNNQEKLDGIKETKAQYETYGKSK